MCLRIKNILLPLHYVNEITTDMKLEKEIEWTTENIIIFSIWLLNRKQYGYSLLCIHGACLGIKVSTLLRLKWSDFIEENVILGDETVSVSKNELIIQSEKKDGKRIYELSRFVSGVNGFVYGNGLEAKSINDFVYVNEKTGKLLSTSTLNRELNKLYSIFKQEVLETTHIELNFTPLKTNTFEILWARDMVAKYHYSKKIFILVSKHMGHRTVNDTINLLGVEPNDDVKICYDLYNPSIDDEMKLYEIVRERKEMKTYLVKKNIGIKTDKFKELEAKRISKLEEMLKEIDKNI